MKPQLKKPIDEAPEAPKLRSSAPFVKSFVTRLEGSDDGEGNWLVSYADLMTLLVGFFAMILSLSNVDSEAFEKLKRDTTLVFGGQYQVPFEKLTEKLKHVISENGLEKQVLFHSTDAGLEVSFKGALFFDSGSADLRSEATALLTQIAPIIQENAKGYGIVIEGHTDGSPVKSSTYPSNWELSSARACRVLRFFESDKFDRTRIKAIGWGDTRPLIPEGTSSGGALDSIRAQNRRVRIRITKQFLNDE
jgi:chemotaxis protein MotB